MHKHEARRIFNSIAQIGFWIFSFSLSFSKEASLEYSGVHTMETLIMMWA